MFTNVTAKDVLSCHDAKSIFEVPQMLYDQGIWMQYLLNLE